jgi:hypothetical protein
VIEALFASAEIPVELRATLEEALMGSADEVGRHRTGYDWEQRVDNWANRRRRL